jgi:uncharacterized protein YdbL (DUF1318 family)
MKILYSIIVLLSFVASSAFALELQEARSQGLLREKPDGYVAVVKSSPEVEALAKEVNAKRLAEYQKISKENGQPVDIVAKLAAQQIQAKLK